MARARGLNRGPEHGSSCREWHGRLAAAGLPWRPRPLWLVGLHWAKMGFSGPTGWAGREAGRAFGISPVG
jgi:hypothetical protein